MRGQRREAALHDGRATARQRATSSVRVLARGVWALGVRAFGVRALGVLALGVLATGCLIDRGHITPLRRDVGPPEAGAIEAGPSCGARLLVCDDGCVDPDTDARHCGRCNAPCDGAACIEGVCQGCPGTVVRGVCVEGLRVWLDARDPHGDGSVVAGSLERWTNLARTSTGDFTHADGTAEVVEGAGGRRVVRLSGAHFASSGVLSESGAHVEIFLVARTRELAPGVALALRGVPPSTFQVQLPSATEYSFALPGGESTLSAPFGRSTRHTTLWHAFGGPDGREVRIDGTTVARGEPGFRVMLGGALLLGGDDDGARQALDIAELIVVDQPLREATRQQLSAGLRERWGLLATEPAARADLSSWLDARRPLDAPRPAEGAVLPHWRDHERSRDQPAQNAVFRADAFGAGRDAVELDPELGPSFVTLPVPSNQAFTALMVVASEDGSGSREGWSSPNWLGADERYRTDDAALVMSGGRVGFGRVGDVSGSGWRIDDGLPHMLTWRRSATGLTEIWIDHAQATKDDVAGLVLVEPWALGQREGGAEGAIAARYGEVLVFTRALDEEELAVTERYLAQRWASPVAAQQPTLTPCAPGSRLACPLTALADLRAAPSGRHWVDLGQGPHRVSIDAAEGGGWALVLQYVRSDTNAELHVLAPGDDWPEMSPRALGQTDRARSARWGHVGAAIAATLGTTSELRWQAMTTAHPRVIHFSSSVGVAAWREGRSDFRGLSASFGALTGATAGLPATANQFGFGWTPDTVLTAFPYYQSGTAHWSVRGAGARWEVDDLDAPGTSTIHRVWVR